MTHDAMSHVLICTSDDCVVTHSFWCGAQEVVTCAARSVSAARRGTDACMVLPEEPSDRERYLGSYPALNPFSAARLTAIDCPLQELLELDACDQVSSSDIFAMHLFRHWKARYAHVMNHLLAMYARVPQKCQGLKNVRATPLQLKHPSFFWQEMVQERLVEALPDVPARCLHAFYQQLASTGVLCSVTSPLVIRSALMARQ